MPRTGAAESISTRTKLLIYLSALSAGILLISNLSAAKLWNFFGIPVDGGAVIFPLSYIIGDVVMEFFGRKTSNHVVWASFFLSIIATTTFWIVSALPNFDPETGNAFSTVLSSVPRVIAGSLAAYVSSQLLNNYVFEKIKQKTGNKWLIVRTYGSSLIAHIVDTLVFDTIAFAGTISTDDFINLIVFAYVFAICAELVLTPVVYLVVGGIRKILNEPLENRNAKKRI